MKRIITALLAALLAASTAQAEEEYLRWTDGSDLMFLAKSYERVLDGRGDRKGKDYRNAMELTGYVTGVVEVSEILSVSCLPDNTTGILLTTVVANYVNTNVNKMHHTGVDVVLMAIGETWPCNQ